VIAVAGGKGGSGKTTTTVGLARALSRRGAPVVAADADWDLPNLSRLATETAEPVAAPAERGPSDGRPKASAGHTAEPGRRTISAVAHDRRDPVGRSTLRRRDRSAPTVLAAPDRPRDVDADVVFDALDHAVPDDTPVLLDCPAGASPDAAAPLRAADRALLVTPLSRPALRDAAKTAAVAERLDCPPLGVVAVRARSVPDGLADLLGCPVVGRIPPAPPTPLTEPAVRSAYDTVARRVVETYGTDRWRIA
jgi:septum site-determining protein MinD